MYINGQSDLELPEKRTNGLRLLFREGVGTSVLLPTLILRALQRTVRMVKVPVDVYPVIPIVCALAILVHILPVRLPD